ncbi:hypothetical protein Y1Q_0009254 [Alligator mississippiensis]|uniref:Uncharacterized protein n=1 Tax=Alligator mississippiensis TaxID=8496 RepID=A0A151M2U8_ALLMI|nr:hypothetical protein Y1Q_0009254 [Alligator mississippiensis]
MTAEGSSPSCAVETTGDWFGESGRSLKSFQKTRSSGERRREHFQQQTGSFQRYFWIKSSEWTQRNIGSPLGQKRKLQQRKNSTVQV